MTLAVEAIYENGVLKPTEPLPLKEHEKATVTVQPATSLARQTAGMVPWTGDADFHFDSGAALSAMAYAT